MSISWGEVVAIYGGLTGSVALLIQWVGWLEAKPKLVVSVMVDARIVGGPPGSEQQRLIAVTVTNRGGAATTITNLSVTAYSGRWSDLRRRPVWAAVVNNPSMFGSPQLPYVLQPGTNWQGQFRYEGEVLERVERLERIYLVVDANHTDRGERLLLRTPWASGPERSSDS